MNRISWLIILAFSSFLILSQKVPAQNEFAGVVKFDKTIHDFGDILITSGEQHCTFTLTNISRQPIAIHRVISSCGCTEPEWTKSPIRPGKTGTINITYKNDQGPYPFDKSITAYISGVDKPIILRVRGLAHDKKKSLKELYTFTLGPLGLREETLNIGFIEQGLTRSEKVEVANLSKKPIKVSFSHLTPGLNLTLSPNPLPPESKGTLLCTIDTKSTKEKMWGKSLFTSEVNINGTAIKEKISIEVLIKENFSGLSEEQRRIGSLPQFANSSLSFGNITSNDSPTISFPFKNIGRSTLEIFKIDCSEEGVSIDFPHLTEGGAGGNITATIHPSKTGSGEKLYILSIITNSPTRPIINIFITGTIE